jgi:hypothetical protein
VTHPTETVMCRSCNGSGEYDWDEIDIFTRCASCDGCGEVEVCAQCLDSGYECDACGVSA